MNSYTNAWNNSAPVVTAGNGADPGTVAAPAPDATRLQNHAQSERCAFFCGRELTATSYTQTVNQVRGWKRTFTYNITPAGTTPSCWTGPAIACSSTG